MDKQALIKALRDTAQSASNAVADQVAAPVDGMAWALRKGGMDIQNPVLGADWMAQYGLTQPVEQGIPKMAGDFIGNVVPALGFTKGAKMLGQIK